MAFDTNAKIIVPNGINGRSFTPTIEIGGAGTGISYGTQYGKLWVMVPGLLFVSARIVLTSKGSLTGPVAIRVPTTDTNGGSIPSFSAAAPAALFALNPIGTGVDQFSARFVASARLIWPYVRTGGTVAQMADTHLGNTTEVNISGVAEYAL